jgi:hypothetical protein
MVSKEEENGKTEEGKKEQEELQNINVFEGHCKTCGSTVYYYKYRVVLLDFSLSGQQSEQTSASGHRNASLQDSELPPENKLVYLTCEGKNTENKKHTCAYKYPDELLAVVYKKPSRCK